MPSTCPVYPGSVTVQFSFHLLLAAQLHEGPPVLHPLPLLGKFSEGRGVKIALIIHNTDRNSSVRNMGRVSLTQTRLPAPGSGQRTSQWWWEEWSTSSSMWDPGRRWSEIHQHLFIHSYQSPILVYICWLHAGAHVIKNGRPSLHGNTLEDGEHSKQDVVELRDAVIGPDPGVVAVVPLRTLPHSTCKRQLGRVNSLIVWEKKDARVILLFFCW